MDYLLAISTSVLYWERILQTFMFMRESHKDPHYLYQSDGGIGPAQPAHADLQQSAYMNSIWEATHIMDFWEAKWSTFGILGSLEEYP
jgi:hypothetical protein